MRPERLTPEGAKYKRLAQEEIEHYTQIFINDKSLAGQSARETLLQPVPQSWIEIETRATALVREQTGADLNEHVLSRLQASPGIRMLSLGSGPGGIELALARQAPEAAISCVDLNPDLVQLGQQRADEERLNVTFKSADLNVIDLPRREYEVVLCHASLHHVLELEHVIHQIEQSLRDQGELIVVDISTPNGYLMHGKTREIVRNLFRMLPPRFRINHTGYAAARVDEEIWEVDTSQVSMECIRSEDIISMLAGTFHVRHFVPYFSLCRRFFDTMYGPNYDLARPLDAAILNFLWHLDVHYLAVKQLEPETFFGIYERRN
jgi:2-polyprenyl-3-methyl-5-hydroxy-6-metoxy-1,4-benzoquinol methylase